MIDWIWKAMAVIVIIRSIIGILTAIKMLRSPKQFEWLISGAAFRKIETDSHTKGWVTLIAFSFVGLLLSYCLIF
jgi:hypothetical protein